MHDSRRTRLVLGVLVIVALVLITLDFRDGGASPVRNVGADVFGPVERITHDVTNPIASLFDSITGGPSAQSTIANLQRENAELRAELSSAKLSQADKQQLAKLLRLDAGAYRIVPASVIAAGGDFSDTVTLDAGRDEGIKPDETVLNGSGFVGTVTQVSADTSTVLLADDATSTIGVQMAGSSGSFQPVGRMARCWLTALPSSARSSRNTSVETMVSAPSPRPVSSKSTTVLTSVPCSGGTESEMLARQCRIAHQLVDRADVPDAALIEHDSITCKLVRDAEVLFDQ